MQKNIRYSLPLGRIPFNVAKKSILQYTYSYNFVIYYYIIIIINNNIYFILARWFNTGVIPGYRIIPTTTTMVLYQQVYCIIIYLFF